MVKQHRVFNFRGVSNEAVIANYHVSPDVSIVSDLAIFSDDRGAFYHRTIFDNSALPDEYFLSDIGHTITTIVKRGMKVLRQVSLNPFKRVPGILAVFEKRGVLSLAEIE